jgi:hypothetical protein
VERLAENRDKLRNLLQHLQLHFDEAQDLLYLLYNRYGTLRIDCLLHVELREVSRDMKCMLMSTRLSRHFDATLCLQQSAYILNDTSHNLYFERVEQLAVTRDMMCMLV